MLHSKHIKIIKKIGKNKKQYHTRYATMLNFYCKINNAINFEQLLKIKTKNFWLLKYYPVHKNNK